MIPVFHKGVPIPSWIELSLIDVCNRKCIFLPKIDPSVAQTLTKMNIQFDKKISKRFKEINYQGSVVLCGYGEPLLHKDIYEISRKLAQAAFVEIVTNGDVLTKDKIKKLYNSNVNKLLISLYDGPEQKEKFIKNG